MKLCGKQIDAPGGSKGIQARGYKGVQRAVQAVPVSCCASWGVKPQWWVSEAAMDNPPWASRFLDSMSPNRKSHKTQRKKLNRQENAGESSMISKTARPLPGGMALPKSQDPRVALSKGTFASGAQSQN